MDFLPELPKKSHLHKRVQLEPLFFDPAYYATSDGLVPAIASPEQIPDGFLPRGAVRFDLLAKGMHPFVILPEGRSLNEDVGDSLIELLHDITSAVGWYNLFVDVKGRSAELFIIDRNNERYRVVRVNVDLGGDSGTLSIQHLGKRSREGILEVDIEEANSYMLPVIVYKPYRPRD